MSTVVPILLDEVNTIVDVLYDVVFVLVMSLDFEVERDIIRWVADLLSSKEIYLFLLRLLSWLECRTPSKWLRSAHHICCLGISRRPPGSMEVCSLYFQP